MKTDFVLAVRQMKLNQIVHNGEVLPFVRHKKDSSAISKHDGKTMLAVWFEKGRLLNMKH